MEKKQQIILLSLIVAVSIFCSCDNEKNNTTETETTTTTVTTSTITETHNYPTMTEDEAISLAKDEVWENIKEKCSSDPRISLGEITFEEVSVKKSTLSDKYSSVEVYVSAKYDSFNKENGVLSSDNLFTKTVYIKK